MKAQKGAHFLVEDIDYKHIFIREEFSEEQKMILQMVQDFCDNEIIAPMRARGDEWHADTDRAVIIEQLQKAAELGLCGVAIGEEYGGMDLDFNTGLIFSEAAAAGFSFATTIGAHTSIGSLPIVYYGTDEQKAKYLPGIASAQLKASYALTEPNAGSDANSGKTRATLSADGKHYLLNGQKMWITNGGFADLFIVFAKIDDDENLTAFIVERSFGGLTTGAEEKKLGIKGSSTVQVFFNDCPVPIENLLGERQGGFKMALNILNTGRIKLASGSNGGCKLAIGKAATYAHERVQFEKPIADFGAIKHKIGEMAAHVFACDAAVYRTGKNIDDKTAEFIEGGMDKSKAKLSAIREYAIECALLKVKGSENAHFSVDETLQIHGGMGFAVETGIEMAYRDSRILRIYEGTNEINRMLSVAELTKRALKTKEIDLVGATKKALGQLLKNYLPFKSKAGLNEEIHFVKNIKAAYLLLSAVSGKKLGKKMIEEQEMIMNLSNILLEAYVAESCLLRVQKIMANKLYDAEKEKVMNSMLKVYLYDALNNCRKAAIETIDSFAYGRSRIWMRFVTRKLLPNYNTNPKEHRRRISEYIVAQGMYNF